MGENENTVKLELSEPYEGCWITIRDPRRMKLKHLKRVSSLSDDLKEAVEAKDRERAAELASKLDAESQGLIVGWNLLDEESGEALDSKASDVFEELTAGQYEAIMKAIEGFKESSPSGASKN